MGGVGWRYDANAKVRIRSANVQHRPHQSKLSIPKKNLLYCTTLTSIRVAVATRCCCHIASERLCDFTPRHDVLRVVVRACTQRAQLSQVSKASNEKIEHMIDVSLCSAACCSAKHACHALHVYNPFCHRRHLVGLCVCVGCLCL